MKEFRLFLTSFVTFLAVGCYTVEYKGFGDMKTGLASSKLNYDEWTRLPKSSDKAYFCEGIEQKRPIKTRLRALIPPPHKSWSITKAQKFQEQYLKSMRFFIKSYFWTSSLYFQKDFWWDLNQPKPEWTIFLSTMSKDEFRNLIQIAKEKQINDYSFQFHGRADHASNLFVSIFSSTEGNIYVIPRDLFGKLNGISGTSIHQTFGLEVSNLVSEYAMVIPKDAQIKLFGAGSGRSYNPIMDQRHYIGYPMGPDEGKGLELDLEDVMQFNTNLWYEYLLNMTTIKETFIDANTVDFEVNLDLGPFCKYGQFKDELMAK